MFQEKQCDQPYETHNLYHYFFKLKLDLVDPYLSAWNSMIWLL